MARSRAAAQGTHRGAAGCGAARVRAAGAGGGYRCAEAPAHVAPRARRTCGLVADRVIACRALRAAEDGGVWALAPGRARLAGGRPSGCRLPRVARDDHRRSGERATVPRRAHSADTVSGQGEGSGAAGAEERRAGRVISAPKWAQSPSEPLCRRAHTSALRCIVRPRCERHHPPPRSPASTGVSGGAALVPRWALGATRGAGRCVPPQLAGDEHRRVGAGAAVPCGALRAGGCVADAIRPSAARCGRSGLDRAVVPRGAGGASGGGPEGIPPGRAAHEHRGEGWGGVTATCD